jgi:hypothetical protein
MTQKLVPHSPNEREDRMMKRNVLTVVLPVALVCIGALQARSEDDRDCSKESLNGSYGFQITGSIPGTLAIAGIARVVFDGQGNFTQTGNSQIIVIGRSPVLSDQTGTGTYTVNPDCTGTETLNVGGQLHHSRFVLVNHGRKVLDTNVDPGVVLTGVGEKQ